MKRFGLISDTHGHLHPDVFALFEGVEAIWHAGDVVGEDILDELEVIAPTLAVQGNCDVPSVRLPMLRVIEAPFGTAILTHSHMIGGGAGPPSRLAEHFAGKSPRVIVYGHTHLQSCESHGGVLVVNPGPSGKPRFRDRPSVAVLEWDEKTDALDVAFEPVDWKRGTS